jgi:multidrug resistance efflux pump
MAFVSNERNTILASFSQSSIRLIAEGNKAEVVFKNLPGQTFSGKVTRVAGFSSEAQLTASGQLPTLTGAAENSRWVVMVELEDQDVARNLPQGAGGTMAVYTKAGMPVHTYPRWHCGLTPGWAT